MQEQHPSPEHEPGHSEAYPADRSDAARTRSFETEPFATEKFETEPFYGEPVGSGQSYGEPVGPQSDATRAYDRFDAETRPFPPAPGPEGPAYRPPASYEPLAHEGGLAYGNPPAPASPPPEQFAPRSLGQQTFGQPTFGHHGPGRSQYGPQRYGPQQRGPQQFSGQHPGYQQFVPQHLAMPLQSAPGPYPQQMPGHNYPYPPQHFQQMVVVNNRRRVNHPLHLILTLLTAGLWLPVWIILMIANS